MAAANPAAPKSALLMMGAAARRSTKKSATMSTPPAPMMRNGMADSASNNERCASPTVSSERPDASKMPPDTSRRSRVRLTSGTASKASARRATTGRFDQNTHRHPSHSTMVPP